MPMKSLVPVCWQHRGLNSFASVQDLETLLLTARQAFLLLPGRGGNEATYVLLQTTIMAASFPGGVVLGADSRTSTGSYVANRVTNKLTQLAEKARCFSCRQLFSCRSSIAATFNRLERK